MSESPVEVAARAVGVSKVYGTGVSATTALDSIASAVPARSAVRVSPICALAID